MSSTPSSPTSTGNAVAEQPPDDTTKLLNRALRFLILQPTVQRHLKLYLPKMLDEFIATSLVAMENDKKLFGTDISEEEAKLSSLQGLIRQKYPSSKLEESSQRLKIEFCRGKLDSEKFFPLGLPENLDDSSWFLEKDDALVVSTGEGAGHSNLGKFVSRSIRSIPAKDGGLFVSTGVGAGLSNLGNMCFMNAILQCLTHTAPLVEALRSHNHARPCNESPGGFCVLDALYDHIDQSLKHSGSTIAPTVLIDNLTHILPSYKKFTQQDAHEFLMHLLDRLEDKCCSNGSIVDNIFNGVSLPVTKCRICDQKDDEEESRKKSEVFGVLSLAIHEVSNLQDAFESFCKQESKGDCVKCKKKVDKIQQNMLICVPPIIILHLKRFNYVANLETKIKTYVGFPLELDLRHFYSSIKDRNGNEAFKYQLYGVVVHEGDLATSGHYYCYIRSSPEKWHKFNDEVVSECSEESVLSESAYLLFYVEGDTPWSSSLMDSLFQNLDDEMTARTVLKKRKTASGSVDKKKKDHDVSWLFAAMGSVDLKNGNFNWTAITTKYNKFIDLENFPKAVDNFLRSKWSNYSSAGGYRRVPSENYVAFIKLMARKLDSHAFQHSRKRKAGKISRGSIRSIPAKDGGLVVSTSVGAGLSNLGNMCFMNAILQCLTHTVPLVEALRSHNHARPCNESPGGFCVLDALFDHIDDSLKHSGSTIAPTVLGDNLTHIHSSYQKNRQQDAHEFLVHLLQRLQVKCCSDGNIVEQIVRVGFQPMVNCRICENKEPPKECERFGVSISTIDAVSKLQDALELFCQQVGKGYCVSCLKEVDKIQQNMLVSVPRIIILHLKRFNSAANFEKMISTHVEFPLELDLGLFFSIKDRNGNEALKYQLYGVVVHEGEFATSGHYYCYIRSSPEKWHKFNDEVVSECSEESVLSEAAYVLFYATVDTPWSSSLMDSQNFDH